MATVTRTVRRPIDEVFAALVDPQTYPHWLVGCREIRAVDHDWPDPGAAFHHRVGLAGPLTVADLSRVEEVDRPHRLVLDVRARPFGRARATFALRPAGERAEARGCEVELDEVPTGWLAPSRPLVDPLIALRNRRSLANLAAYLERGESHADPPG